MAENGFWEAVAGAAGGGSAALGAAWLAFRSVRRGVSRDGVEGVKDQAERDHVATLSAENTTLRARHDDVYAKYVEAVGKIGELTGKVTAQTDHISRLEGEVQALRALVAKQTATIEHLILSLSGREKTNGTGPLDWSAPTPPASGT